MEAGRGSLLEATLAAVQPSPSSIPWRGESSDRGSEVRRAERGVSTLAGGVYHTATDERDRDAALPTRGSRARVELVRRLPQATRRQKVKLKPTHRHRGSSVETSRATTSTTTTDAHDTRSTPEVVLAKVKQVMGFPSPIASTLGKTPLMSPIKRRIPLDEVGVVRKELVEPTRVSQIEILKFYINNHGSTRWGIRLKRFRGSLGMYRCAHMRAPTNYVLYPARSLACSLPTNYCTPLTRSCARAPHSLRRPTGGIPYQGTSARALARKAAHLTRVDRRVERWTCERRNGGRGELRSGVLYRSVRT